MNESRPASAVWVVEGNQVRKVERTEEEIRLLKERENEIKNKSQGIHSGELLEDSDDVASQGDEEDDEDFLEVRFEELPDVDDDVVSEDYDDVALPSIHDDAISEGGYDARPLEDQDVAELPEDGDEADLSDKKDDVDLPEDHFEKSLKDVTGKRTKKRAKKRRKKWPKESQYSDAEGAHTSTAGIAAKATDGAGQKETHHGECDSGRDREDDGHSTHDAQAEGEEGLEARKSADFNQTYQEADDGLHHNGDVRNKGPIETTCREPSSSWGTGDDVLSQTSSEESEDENPDWDLVPETAARSASGLSISIEDDDDDEEEEEEEEDDDGGDIIDDNEDIERDFSEKRLHQGAPNNGFTSDKEHADKTDDEIKTFKMTLRNVDQANTLSSPSRDSSVEEHAGDGETVTEFGQHRKRERPLTAKKNRRNVNLSWETEDNNTSGISTMVRDQETRDRSMTPRRTTGPTAPRPSTATPSQRPTTSLTPRPASTLPGTAGSGASPRDRGFRARSTTPTRPADLTAGRSTTAFRAQRPVSVPSQARRSMNVPTREPETSPTTAPNPTQEPETSTQNPARYSSHRHATSEDRLAIANATLLQPTASPAQTPRPPTQRSTTCPKQRQAQTLAQDPLNVSNSTATAAPPQKSSTTCTLPQRPTTAPSQRQAPPPEMAPTNTAPGSSVTATLQQRTPAQRPTTAPSRRPTHAVPAVLRPKTAPAYRQSRSTPSPAMRIALARLRYLTPADRRFLAMSKSSSMLTCSSITACKATMERDLKAKSEELEDAKHQLDEEKESRKNLQRELQVAQQSLHDAQNNVQRSQDSVEKLRLENKRKTEQVEKMERSMSQMEDRIRNLEIRASEVEKAELTLESTRRNLESSQHECRAKESEIQRLQDKYEKTCQDLEQARNTIKDLEKKIEDLKHQVRHELIKNENIERGLETIPYLKDDIADRDKRIGQLEKEIDEKSALLTSSRKTVRDYKDKIRDLERLESAGDSVRKELELAQQEVVSLKHLIGGKDSLLLRKCQALEHAKMVVETLPRTSDEKERAKKIQQLLNKLSNTQSDSHAHLNGVQQPNGDVHGNRRKHPLTPRSRSRNQQDGGRELSVNTSPFQHRDTDFTLLERCLQENNNQHANATRGGGASTSQTAVVHPVRRAASFNDHHNNHHSHHNNHHSHHNNHHSHHNSTNHHPRSRHSPRPTSRATTTTLGPRPGTSPANMYRPETRASSRFPPSLDYPLGGGGGNATDEPEAWAAHTANHHQTTQQQQHQQRNGKARPYSAVATAYTVGELDHADVECELGGSSKGDDSSGDTDSEAGSSFCGRDEQRTLARMQLSARKKDELLAAAIAVGDRVTFTVPQKPPRYGRKKPRPIVYTGIVKYVGRLDKDHYDARIYCGVRLDEPNGESDGVYKGKRYMFSPLNHAKFFKIRDVSSILDVKSGQYLPASRLLLKHLKKSHSFYHDRDEYLTQTM